MGIELFVEITPLNARFCTYKNEALTSKLLPLTERCPKAPETDLDAV